MPRRRRPREQQPLPPPLPPETRTVGQLVAETMRLYGRKWKHALALGVAPALLVVAATTWDSFESLVVIAFLGAVANAVAFTLACFIVSGEALGRQRLLRGLAAGLFVFLPVPFLAVLAPFWLALIGLAVPAAVIEQRRFDDALRRGWQLARADLVHAIGSLAALTITALVTAWVMFVLIRAGSDQQARISAGLTSLVLSPLLYLGAGLLYYDQAARVGSRPPARERSRDADVPDADDADRPGAADAALESGPAARGEP